MKYDLSYTSMLESIVQLVKLNAPNNLGWISDSERTSKKKHQLRERDHIFQCTSLCNNTKKWFIRQYNYDNRGIKIREFLVYFLRFSL